jgi:hypothetical protein
MYQSKGSPGTDGGVSEIASTEERPYPGSLGSDKRDYGFQADVVGSGFAVFFGETDGTRLVNEEAASASYFVANTRDGSYPGIRLGYSSPPQTRKSEPVMEPKEPSSTRRTQALLRVSCFEA